MAVEPENKEKGVHAIVIERAGEWREKCDFIRTIGSLSNHLGTQRGIQREHDEDQANQRPIRDS